MGDMACHILGTPNMAMRLTAPTSVECIKLEGRAKYTFPYRIAIRFDFPSRGTMPPLKLFWYDRLTAQPKFEGVPEGELLGDNRAELFTSPDFSSTKPTCWWGYIESKNGER